METSVSNIWDVFRKVDPKVKNCAAICLVTGCDEMVPRSNGGTSGMRKHAKKYHGIVVPVKQVQENRKGKRVQNQVQMNSFVILKAQYPLHYILSHMVALEGSTFFSIATGQETRKNLEARIVQDKISLKLPSCHKTVKDYVMTFGQEMKTLLKTELHSLVTQGSSFSIDFDEWTSVSNKKYLNISLFNNKKLWNLGLVRVPGHADAVTVMELVEDRLSTFGIELEKHVVSLVTDGAKVMLKIRDNSILEHQLCLAHGLHLAVIDVLYHPPKSQQCVEESDDDSEFEDDSLVHKGLELQNSEPALKMKNTKVVATVKHIRHLSRMFKKSSLNNSKLQEYVNKKFGDPNDPTKSKVVKPLKSDCETRWTSLFEMLKRYQEIRECVDHTLLDLKIPGVTAEENYIVDSIVKVLEPLHYTVKALCRKDANLLTARAALKLMLIKLESQSSIMAKAMLKQVKIRILERVNTNFGVLQYLISGNYKNDYVEKSVVDDESDEEIDISEFNVEDESSIFNDEIFDDQLYPDLLNAHQIFEIPYKADVKEKITSLITRFRPVPPPSLYSSQDLSEQGDEEPPKKRKLTYEEKLELAIQSATTASPPPAIKTKSIASLVQQEMNLFEKSSGHSERGHYLELVFNLLMTIKPTSVESERAFSVAGYLCTKIRNRFNDDTLDVLCFLRHYFRTEQ